MGSCLFFRDYLILSHLTEATTKNIYNYVNHYGLFLLTRSTYSNQHHVWKEIYLPNASNFKTRRFLVVAGFVSKMITKVN